MTAGDQILAGALLIGALAVVTLVILIASTIERDDAQVEEVTYDRARAAGIALSTPVVLPAGHPARGVVDVDELHDVLYPEQRVEPGWERWAS